VSCCPPEVVPAFQIGNGSGATSALRYVNRPDSESPNFCEAQFRASGFTQNFEDSGMASVDRCCAATVAADFVNGNAKPGSGPLDRASHVFARWTIHLFHAASNVIVTEPGLAYPSHSMVRD
jgi:hypothetical protein